MNSIMTWVKFCLNFPLKKKNPILYFSTVGSQVTKMPGEWLVSNNGIYENFKEKISKIIENLKLFYIRILIMQWKQK